MTIEEVKFINGEKNARLELASAAIAGNNETQRQLAGQLILVAGTIITVGSIFLGPDRSKSFGYHSELAFLVSLALFVLSIVAGIVGFIYDANFFKEWHGYHYKIAERLGTGKYTSSNIKDVEKGLKHPKKSSPRWPLYAQITFISLGGLFFLLLIVHLQLAQS